MPNFPGGDFFGLAKSGIIRSILFPNMSGGGELLQVFSQYSLIGVGGGFSGERYSDKLDGECWQYWWSVNQTRTWRWPQAESRSNLSPLG